MRRRVTFVHEPQNPIDPEGLVPINGALQIQGLKAAREERFIVGLYELPQEVWRALKQCHELHLRWTSSRPYNHAAPFVSNTSPGLHLFYTPLKNQSAILCSILDKTFGSTLTAQSCEKALTRPSIISERFASSASLQYHEELRSLNNIVVYVREKLCPKGETSCQKDALRLAHADHLDLDYDAISQTFTVSAYFEEAVSVDGGKQREGWDESISDYAASVPTEIGILSIQKATQPEEISLGGFLITLDKDKPKPTLFSFPSRHHAYRSNHEPLFKVRFDTPTGLHPTLRLTFNRTQAPPAPSCSLHAYSVLPSSFFIDKYQMSSANFLASNNLRSLRALDGETDLEAPIWAVEKWGSAMLLELAPPTITNAEVGWSATVPLHLRYLRASSSHDAVGEATAKESTVATSMPWPVVFWACPAEEGTKMSTNPFDRGNLGYDGLFGPRTMFYHLSPTAGNGSLVESIAVPVLDPQHAAWIEQGTIGTIMLGFLWVCWVLVRPLKGQSGGAHAGKGEKAD